ncbi:hypothetical protein Hamer_G026620 [Homarus americanus]|uniref:Uncharacterized protein n=1 Tax=Homarus americanus TaxID=6706 RepID=A0A8J5JD67_HOMAM|nr:hypothetical protein Hamer_G026620 [Homarus americanus]
MRKSLAETQTTSSPRPKDCTTKDLQGVGSEVEINNFRSRSRGWRILWLTLLAPDINSVAGVLKLYLRA